MLPKEIKKISSLSFAELWDDMWSNIVDNNNDPGESKKNYTGDFIIAQKKFTKIKNATSIHGIFPLDWYLDKVKPLHTYNEWGFPKGRRNFRESNLDCAVREFCEETSLNKEDFVILDKIVPIEENFIGTDGAEYKYVYYVAGLINNSAKLDIKKLNDMGEIGDIGWFTYDNAYSIIRSYHTSRMHILTNIYSYVMNTIINNKNIVNTMMVSV
jgi:8-oxo-dGTP pyrophosphatase MutT (NUDIX family)